MPSKSVANNATHVQPALATPSLFWKTFQPFDGAPLIEESNRDYLVDSRVVFAVESIRLGETREYGATWFVDAAYIDEGGTFRVDAIPMSPNPVRDRMLNAMKTYLEAETDGEREPLFTVMELTTTATGQRAFIFRAPNPDTDLFPSLTADEVPF